MSQDSLLQRTGQLWKLRALTLGSLLAFVFFIIAPWLRNDASPSEKLAYGILGFVCAAFGLIIGFLTIRCPACHANWASRAARQHSSLWLKWLVSLQTCPECGSNGHTAT